MTEEEAVRLGRLRNNSTQGSGVSDIYAAECQKCGVCCAYYSQRPFGVPVRVTDASPKKLVQIGPRLDRHINRYMRTTPLDSRAFFGWQGFRKCVALEGKIGVDTKCGIYGSRPQSCSGFTPGSPACNHARRWAHIPLPDDIMELGHS